MEATPKLPSKPASLFAWDHPGRSKGPALSVVLPMMNEEGAAASLVREIAVALTGVDFEIIAVDDCSTDGTRAALIEEKNATPQLRIIAHGANAGQSRAIRTGVAAARGSVIATLDGDGQNDPADIPSLYRQLLRAESPETLAMVAGERRERRDAAARRWSSRAANAVRVRLLKDGASDTGCGLKVFYREAFLRLPAFDHMHRYLPALMRREGFLVEYVPVGHRPRIHGRSKYTNLGRLAVAFRDLMGVMWLNDRARSPSDISEL
jgi:dolichol-phosphate mannosyltransferase